MQQQEQVRRRHQNRQQPSQHQHLHLNQHRGHRQCLHLSLLRRQRHLRQQHLGQEQQEQQRRAARAEDDEHAPGVPALLRHAPHQQRHHAREEVRDEAEVTADEERFRDRTAAAVVRHAIRRLRAEMTSQWLRAREPGRGQRAQGADHRAQQAFDRCKAAVKAQGLAGPGAVRVNKAGCLDRCAGGPVAVVYPEAVWYTFVDDADIDVEVIALAAGCYRDLGLRRVRLVLNSMGDLAGRAAFVDALREHLKSKGIATEIHYPVPLHLQPCYAQLGYRRGEFPAAERSCGLVLSLPLYPELSLDAVSEIGTAVQRFLR